MCLKGEWKFPQFRRKGKFLNSIKRIRGSDKSVSVETLVEKCFY